MCHLCIFGVKQIAGFYTLVFVVAFFVGTFAGSFFAFVAFNGGLSYTLFADGTSSVSSFAMRST
jgi:hypothetical protein